MKERIAQRGAAERITGGSAEQVTKAARAAALAERRRLARDLHDSVSQTLISLQLTAQAAAELWDSQPAQARAALDTIRHLAAGATTEMRALLVDLHEAVLQQHGLVGALEAYSAVVRQRSGLPVELRVGERGAGDRAGTDGPGAAARGARGGALSPRAGGPGQRGQARPGHKRHRHARAGHDGARLHRG